MRGRGIGDADRHARAWKHIAGQDFAGATPDTDPSTESQKMPRLFDVVQRRKLDVVDYDTPFKPPLSKLGVEGLRIRRIRQHRGYPRRALRQGPPPTDRGMFR